MYASAPTPAAAASASKLRSACDQCHGAKVSVLPVARYDGSFELTQREVRCSGEKTGCSRCQRGHKECRYSISHMGKQQPGRRTRRRRAPDQLAGDAPVDGPPPLLFLPDQQQHQQQQHHHHHHHQHPPHPPPPPSWLPLLSTDPFALPPEWDPPVSPLSAHDLSELLGLPFGAPDDADVEADDAPLPSHASPPVDYLASPSPVHKPSSSASSSSSSASSSSSSSSSTCTSWDLLAPFHFSSAASVASSTADTITTPTTTAGTDTAAAPNLTEWIHLLHRIDDRVSQMPLALDQTLNLSASLLPKVPVVLRHLRIRAHSTTTTFLTILLLCLTQLLVLWESSVSMDPPGSSQLKLRLGGFQVDREAQHLLQTHIVCKELKKFLEILALCKALLVQQQQQQQQQRSAVRQNKVYHVLIDDLQTRTQALMTLLNKKSRSSS